MNPVFPSNRDTEGGAGSGFAGDWGGLRPRFEDPMSWSLPMASVGKIDLRIHALFLLFVVIELARATLVDRDSGGYAPLALPWTALWLIFLWWLVLAHEVGHTVVARMLGGKPREILMWPLGGLARARTYPGWSAYLLTSLAGPAVNLIVFVVLGSVLLWQTGNMSVVFPPPLLDSEFLAPGIVATADSWFLTGLFIIHWANAIVLAFNLLPLFPFDGAHIVLALVWRSKGYVPAMRVVARMGVIGAVVLGILAILLASGVNAAYTIALAFFCGLISVNSMRRLEFTEEMLEDSESGEGFEYSDSPEESGVIGRFTATVDRKQNPKVDQILEKIQTKGLKSLSFRERWALRRATRRHRKEKEQ